jgi:glycosyltransferase involved in cell wall biosynthesis
MPVYNEAKWLDQAVASVLSQNFSDLELVVIDDGSTDATPVMLSAFTRSDDRVRVFRQDHLGVTAARNRGLSEARAPFIAPLDADDRAVPERIDHQIRFLQVHADIGLLGSWAEIIDEHGNHLDWRRSKTRPEELVTLLEQSNPVVHSSVMLRADIVRRLGGYRSAFRAAEDYDLWLRIVEVTNVAILPEFLVQFRSHSASMTERDKIGLLFFTRLAQSSAKARRQNGTDLANGLSEPPDWNAPCTEADFYCRDAKICRLLNYADRNCSLPDAAPDRLDFSLLIDEFEQLSRAERRLAIKALLNYRTPGYRSDASRRKLLLQLLWQHPAAVLVLGRNLVADFARVIGMKA